MTHYFYKSSCPTVVAELKAWESKKAAFDTARERLADVFGAPGSPMKSGTTLYVGGVKLSTDSKHDPYWCRQDEFGYRSLRSAAKVRTLTFLSQAKRHKRIALGITSEAIIKIPLTNNNL